MASLAFVPHVYSFYEYLSVEHLLFVFTGHASGQNEASVCKSMIVKPDDKKSLKSCLGKALDSANSIQIAAQTLRECSDNIFSSDDNCFEIEGS